jgi:lipopolysaccharide/colanic/teichoic acid biosynthesis glycosyltransferase
MSLVGPRPLLPQYLALYSEEQKRRHEIRPELPAGHKWQKCYRLEQNLDTMCIMSITRVLLDMKIIILTVKKVLVRERYFFNNISNNGGLYGK